MIAHSARRHACGGLRVEAGGFAPRFATLLVNRRFDVTQKLVTKARCAAREHVIHTSICIYDGATRQDVANTDQTSLVQFSADQIYKITFCL